MKQKIGILDYGAGNIRSVENSLMRFKIDDFFVSDSPEILATADKIIFPGVGCAGDAMKNLHQKKLDFFLKTYQKPVFCICLGMQLLFVFSEEENTECLGIIPGRVVRFDEKKVGKVPHMGWNKVTINNKEKSKKVANDQISAINYFYFVHSYFAPISEFTVAQCNYNGQKFSAALRFKNFFATQFHPEKSGEAGEILLKEFLF